ncbi:MAG: polymerase subunit epsilon [Patescibacteria group bacterium]|nr:polymerase subunit epsilon [Patescibacteria group bacterium]
MKVHNLAFIDTETTGTDPNKHEIIELAVIIARQVPREGKGPKIEIIEEVEWKIKPEHIETAEDEALRINGYNEVDWMFAVDRKKAMEEFVKKTESCTFVSHNLTFDYAFIQKAFEETGVESRMHYAKLDTISMAFARLYDAPQADKFSLRALCALLKVENPKAHTALADTRALVDVYRKMMGAY